MRPPSFQAGSQKGHRLHNRVLSQGLRVSMRNEKGVCYRLTRAGSMQRASSPAAVGLRHSGGPLFTSERVAVGECAREFPVASSSEDVGRESSCNRSGRCLREIGQRSLQISCNKSRNFIELRQSKVPFSGALSTPGQIKIMSFSPEQLSDLESAPSPSGTNCFYIRMPILSRTRLVQSNKFF